MNRLNGTRRSFLGLVPFLGLGKAFCPQMTPSYARIERRVLTAHGYKRVLGRDIYRTLAAKLYGIPPDKVTEAQRKAAKSQAYFLLYGNPGRSLPSEPHIVSAPEVANG